MVIWVDADACPGAVKEVLFRAAERTETRLVLVANQTIRHPNSRWIEMLRVSSGFDVADNTIVKQVSRGDLVITADIPLAAEVIEAGANALNPRGEVYSPDTIKSQLTMRDFMDTMRATGVRTGGPPPFSQQDKKQFANALDRILARSARA